MDHFLSSLEHGASPWYSPRPASVATHGHEFAIGNSSFQLIPISNSANNVVSNHNTYTTTTNATQTVSQSAFKPPLASESPKVKSEKEEDELLASKTPSPSVALTPLSTNMSHHSHKAKNVMEDVCRCERDSDESNDIIGSYARGERWDTKKVCNICGKVLSRGDKLKNHIRTHTNNFPFHCDTCGQGFLRSEGLRVHTRIHTGERPYVCIVCGKSYTRKDKLTRHAIVHTGERPFVCQHCGKSFTRKDKMQRHEMIHKIDKPFTCVPCNLEFVRQETFNAHMERKHPERLPYTVVQHSRANSPGYHPQGLNLSENKGIGAKPSLTISKPSTSTTSVSASSSSASPPTSIHSPHSPHSTTPASSSTLLSSSSLLSTTSLLSSSALGGMSLHGGSVVHHHLS